MMNRDVSHKSTGMYSRRLREKYHGHIILASECKIKIRIFIGKRYILRTVRKRKEIFVMKIGYARVSTREQNLDMQVIALENASCEKI